MVAPNILRVGSEENIYLESSVGGEVNLIVMDFPLKRSKLYEKKQILGDNNQALHQLKVRYLIWMNFTCSQHRPKPNVYLTQVNICAAANFAYFCGARMQGKHFVWLRSYIMYLHDVYLIILNSMHCLQYIYIYIFLTLPFSQGKNTI